MGSWAACYVHDRSPDAVASCCHTWLDVDRAWFKRLTTKPVTITRGEYDDGLPNWGIMNASSRPTGVVIYGRRPWVTVKYDRFCQPNELARFLSTTLETRVVDTQGQTTSDAEVFDRGATRRRLDFAADAGWIEQRGEPLPGEPNPLESPNDDEPDDPDLGWFDYDAVARYVDKTFGIAWWSLPEPGAPVTLVGPVRGRDA